jgi:type II secretory pathway predicted ATPase ExeA
MNAEPFPFRDFTRALDSLEAAIQRGDDPYLLLTADTGTGKTALLRGLRSRLDRCRFRLAYFSQSRLLGAMGFVRVIARTLHVACRRTHPETSREVIRQLEEDPGRLLLWFDDANELPAETLGEARALVESNLGGPSQITVLFAGLPELRERLQGIPPMWRRIVVREEISGLLAEELRPFLEHHFSAPVVSRLTDDGLTLLFEQGRGVPGLVLPMFRTLLSKASGKGRIDPSQIEDTLAAWNLP